MYCLQPSGSEASIFLAWSERSGWLCRPSNRGGARNDDILLMESAIEDVLCEGKTVDAECELVVSSSGISTSIASDSLGDEGVARSGPLDAETMDEDDDHMELAVLVTENVDRLEGESTTDWIGITPD